MCIHTWEKELDDGTCVTLPCGQCILCRMKRAQNWAIKLIKEASYHKKMCMATLTFDPRKLIDHECGSNVLYSKDLKQSTEHFKKFMKRLRKRFEAGKISYFKIGEYGEKHGRAHYHVIFYGIDKNDLKCKPIGKSKKNKTIYGSQILDDCWKLGITTISEVTNATIKYVCNYTLKKIKHIKQKQVPYSKIKNNVPKYYIPKKSQTIMSFSSRNKIGTKWARRYHKEFRKGYIVDSEGQKYGIPKSWKKELERTTQYAPMFKSMQETAEILEEKTMDFLEEARKSGKLSLSNLKKKAWKLEYRLQNNGNQQRLDL